MLFQYPTIKTLAQHLSQTTVEPDVIAKNDSSRFKRRSISKQQKKLRQQHRQVKKQYDS